MGLWNVGLSTSGPSSQTLNHLTTSFNKIFMLEHIKKSHVDSAFSHLIILRVSVRSKVHLLEHH